jgi:lipopolysaccharide export system protein LptA
MKRSEAARYARWCALAALVFAMITGGIYLQRKWAEHKEIRQAPPPLAEDQERQSIGLTLSKHEGERTIFTVEASKSTDFKGKDISLLEDVKITIFGKTGERHDVIHTHTCNYVKTDGDIQCGGEVQMDLQSAEDVERAKHNGGQSNIIHLETSGVTFDKASGKAQTAQHVAFTFANGDGEGMGGVYYSEDGVLQLLKQVRVTIHGTVTPGAKGQSSASSSTSTSTSTAKTKEVVLHGNSLEMGKQTRKVSLFGPSRATTDTQELTAGEIDALLDTQFRIQTLLAIPGSLAQEPELIMQGQKGAQKLRADQMQADLTAEGWVSSVEAQGNLQGNSAEGEMHADNGAVEMWPKVNHARLVTLRGNVRVDGHDQKTGLPRKLKTEALQMAFAGGEPNEHSELQHAETLERGMMAWSDAGGAQSVLSADKLTADFGATGKVQHLVGKGNVETQRDIPGKPTQTATATEGDVQLDAVGEWTQMNLHGNVHLKQGLQNAEAQQAVFVRAAQTAVLTGQAVARDDSSETRATKITFHQDSGDIEAEGRVRSTNFGEKKPSIQMSPDPANVTAEHMTGNSKTGRALYTGHARMWQGPSVLEAKSIELLKETRELHAKGDVRAVFPQQSNSAAPGSDVKSVAAMTPAKVGMASSGGKVEPVSSATKTGAAAGATTPKEPANWHIVCGTLTYWDAENRAHLEQDVVAQSEDERMRAPVLELYFTRAADAKPGTEGTAQISRAVGTGGVIVEQGDKKGTAERAVYTAEDSKFVLTGGTPTVYEPLEGSTTGRELTFNIADDTIVVDSGNGTKTLTKHRVQK